jgi:DNA modification methylase
METTHRIIVGDARSLNKLSDNSVEMVITSPPYPMIEMWDGLFSELNKDIGRQLESENGQKAFELMHEELEKVWRELSRVLVDGGVACINIGDATRNIGGGFRVFHNHSQITHSLTDLGFIPLPEILWRKPANSGVKFRGSGMTPPNAYVTLEHEYILVFRKGESRREFEPKADKRYEAAYFWEERNKWFSDVWTGVTGKMQELGQSGARERSAAYPFEIPYRLINMYSVYDDTVLDPFWGTGTTTLAAMASRRNSIGYELDESLVSGFEDRARAAPQISDQIARERLSQHRKFVENETNNGNTFNHHASNYNFPVTSSDAIEIQLYTVEDVEPVNSGYRAFHSPVTEVGEPLHKQPKVE